MDLTEDGNLLPSDVIGGWTGVWVSWSLRVAHGTCLLREFMYLCEGSELVATAMKAKLDLKIDLESHLCMAELQDVKPWFSKFINLLPVKVNITSVRERKRLFVTDKCIKTYFKFVLISNSSFCNWIIVTCFIVNVYKHVHVIVYYVYVYNLWRNHHGKDIFLRKSYW